MEGHRPEIAAPIRLLDVGALFILLIVAAIVGNALLLYLNRRPTARCTSYSREAIMAAVIDAVADTLGVEESDLVGAPPRAVTGSMEPWTLRSPSVHAQA